MKVIINATLGPLWGTPEELKSMTDEEIIEMCHEDHSGLLEEAIWEIKREGGER